MQKHTAGKSKQGVDTHGVKSTVPIMTVSADAGNFAYPVFGAPRATQKTMLNRFAESSAIALLARGTKTTRNENDRVRVYLEIQPAKRTG